MAEEKPVMSDRFIVPDGLDELKEEMPRITALIVRTARWVHPETFRALPVWYPETARGLPIYDAKWTRVYKNTSRATSAVREKAEANIRAGKALVAALGTRKTDNWTVCHIWSVDDPKFKKTNTVVCDRRFYSCVANMIWLPTPLKGFTDAVPDIRRMLRICAYYLYGWVCQHPDVASQAVEVRSGKVPAGYPLEWPAPGRRILPPGTAPYSPGIARAIMKRKKELQRMLDDPELTHFPREAVHNALEFWRVELASNARWRDRPRPEHVPHQVP
jgi:hypothetical protein